MLIISFFLARVLITVVLCLSLNYNVTAVELCCFAQIWRCMVNDSTEIVTIGSGCDEYQFYNGVNHLYFSCCLWMGVRSVGHGPGAIVGRPRVKCGRADVRICGFFGPENDET